MSAESDVRLIRIVHISDIHFGESVSPSDTDRAVPGRKPHDLTSFRALNHALTQDLKYDMIVVSGDLTQQGHPSSFHYVHNWLADGFIGPEGARFGLQLERRQIPFIVVPGNHDRYGGTQYGTQKHDDSAYESQFDALPNTAAFNIQGIDVTVHAIDSTDVEGGYARGYVDPSSCSHFPSSDRRNKIDLAVLHHHVVEPAHRVTDHLDDLRNSSQAMGYLLGSGFDAVLFGHKHYPFFDILPGRTAARLVRGRRDGTRLMRSLWRSIIARHKRPVSIFSMPIESRQTRSGLFVTIRSIIDYEYLSSVRGMRLKTPSRFENPRDFYEYITSKTGDNPPPSVNDMRDRCRVAVSMAPSACQFDERGHGFFILEFLIHGNLLVDVCADLYTLDGGRFRMNSRCWSKSYGRESRREREAIRKGAL